MSKSGEQPTQRPVRASYVILSQAHSQLQFLGQKTNFGGNCLRYYAYRKMSGAC